jgi:HK97 family phage major capsid protein
MKRIEELRQKLAQLAKTMEAITAAAEARSESFTEEEKAQFDEADAGFKATQEEIARLERLEDVQAAMSSVPRPRVEPALPSGGAVESPQASGRPPITGKPVAHNFANHGFRAGPPEYYAAVRNASAGRVDPRLMLAAVSTWAGETVGADGGWAMPPQFAQGIMSQVMPEDSFLGSLQPYPTQSDILTIPTDEDAPWSSSGITATKTAEGVAITASKPALKQVKVVMYGVKSLVHVDEKALRDMAFMSAYVERKMAEKIRYKIENYVLNGSGENEPLGIINAPSLLALADSASTATAIGAVDVMAMESRSLPGPGGFWIAHTTVMPLVRTLTTGANGWPLYTTDYKQSPAGGLLGYPLFKSVAAKALNTTGDLLFVKPSGYLLAFESGGIQNATTIAFAFDQNLQSFRSTLYMGGAPLLSSTVTLPDGSTAVSNLVALAGSRS